MLLVHSSSSGLTVWDVVRDTLLSANQDGTVRIFVTRSNSSNSNNSTITLNAQADACRDAQFNPFHSHILASIYENGNVAIWDRRMPEQVLQITLLA